MIRHAFETAIVAALLAGCDCTGNIAGGVDAGTRDGSVSMDGRVPGQDTGMPPVDSSIDAPAVSVDSGGVDGGGTTGTDAAIPVWDGSVAGGIAPCQGHIYLCGNGMDDDGDGLADAADLDCLGPCDNNEAGFFLNIPGGDHPACALDCYFDQDQGSGNDSCEWDHRCDPEFMVESGRCAGPLVGRPPADARCPDPQSATCHDICSPLVPNGCDCFGCCNLPNGETEPDPRPGHAGETRLVYRFIGSLNGSGTPTCTLAALDAATSDAEMDAACHRCTPVLDCLNTCGRCELCLGRSLSDLAPDCFPSPRDAGTTSPVDGGGAPVDSGTPTIDVCSDPARQDCGVPGLPACPAGYYCITGCCTYFG